ncbi:DUF2795 domain-containing protein [Streptomyces sp. RS10V-4]|uniref:DUF2795 domain-containing protein n=1 Tax=Streptomyces rhizoryzae TaxID=2932493 RepID=UPI00200424AB|nr:DUF2795 domain-containing protein [Streptomyces rhizoryzae]MCK7625851.1 DUF2795 domain-containing protein [Streptomyces rhizoryzae]
MAGKSEGGDPIKLQKALKNAHYPSSRDDLVSVARHNKADGETVQRISGIDDKQYNGPGDVQKAVYGSG